MILILTMAGRYQRFANEGYKMPKYLLPWGDKTILSVVLSNLINGGDFSAVYLVANCRDEAYMPHVKAMLRAVNIPADHLIMTSDTSGQAETALVGLDALARLGVPEGEPIVFHNVDTLILRRNFDQMKSALQVHDGFIDVFTSNNRGYSYVLLNDKGSVSEIAEKVLVSDLATSGLYGFKSAAAFRDHYAPGTDIFISSIYKRMLADGARVAISDVHQESDTIVLGTPEEYMNSSLILLVEDV